MAGYRSPGHHDDGGSLAEIFVGRSAIRWLRLYEQRRTSEHRRHRMYPLMRMTSSASALARPLSLALLLVTPSSTRARQHPGKVKGADDPSINLTRGKRPPTRLHGLLPREQDANVFRAIHFRPPGRQCLALAQRRVRAVAGSPERSAHDAKG
jgi:hypothetical protein